MWIQTEKPRPIPGTIDPLLGIGTDIIASDNSDIHPNQICDRCYKAIPDDPELNPLSENARSVFSTTDDAIWRRYSQHPVDCCICKEGRRWPSSTKNKNPDLSTVAVDRKTITITKTGQTQTTNESSTIHSQTPVQTQTASYTSTNTRTNETVSWYSNRSTTCSSYARPAS